MSLADILEHAHHCKAPFSILRQGLNLLYGPVKRKLRPEPSVARNNLLAKCPRSGPESSQFVGFIAGSDPFHGGSGSMSSSNPLLRPRPTVIWRYGIAVFSVVAALILTHWPVLHLEESPLALFIFAVLISAWLGGAAPGLLATALSTLAFDYYFLLPIHSLAVKPEAIPRLIGFAGSLLFAGLLSAAQRSATESIRSARDDLKVTVQELQNTNEALQAESRERKSAEESLRRSEGYLAEAQRLSHTGSWASVPSRGEIRYLSEECYRVLGFDPLGGQPRYEMFFQRIHPDDQVKVREAVETAGREKAEFELDYRIIHPGGETRDIHAVGHPVLSPSGELGEFVGTVIDITGRKRAEEEREKLRQAIADLAHVNRVTTMGELTASLAHEVNQPISAAVTNANTCLRWLNRESPDLEEARAAAMRIVKDGTRAAEIISRVRVLFKKGTPERELVDVNEIIREMIVLLHSEARRYDISVQVDLAADLPVVMGDRVQLQQVLMNLIMNSIDAMKEMDGARELTIKSNRSEEEQLMVSVSDTGVGLPTMQANQIFDAFFTSKLHGTGMGLRISRSIIESHGGRLWAGDNSPRGASFYVSLPTKVEEHELP
jgi:PAS domain S-box-containing protein